MQIKQQNTISVPLYFSSSDGKRDLSHREYKFLERYYRSARDCFLICSLYIKSNCIDSVFSHYFLVLANIKGNNCAINGQAS